MSKIVKAVADAIFYVWWGHGTSRQPDNPNVIASVALRKVVEELKYIGITEKNILELADELEDIKQNPPYK